MGIVLHSKFHIYKNRLFSLPSPFQEADLINDQFLLDKDEKRKIEIYYAPFDYINEHAKIAIIGITPGLHQMKKSFSTILSVKDQLADEEEMLHEVKKNSSFEGTMRKNLIAMLDELQLHTYLGLPSTKEFFDKANDLVHTASMISYPVFYDGKNFNGSRPNILKTDLLKKYIVENFVPEINRLNKPLIIPLGVNVSNVLNFLIENHYIPSQSILSGFPHPSGSNGHRHRQFAENKEQMKNIIQTCFG
ncbi:hypothetical protein [Metabacillus fastidiosus]|uniref:hypothetical protein n=1 Tax=Metabacillus fastidiosus TaxID=1458 RepID=UPI002E2514B5|nr:hypothetical protein [Metabacillus fastidiosus]